MTTRQAVTHAISALGLSRRPDDAASDEQVERCRRAIADGAYDVPGPTRALLDAEDAATIAFNDYCGLPVGSPDEPQAFFRLTDALTALNSVREQVRTARKMAKAVL